MNVNKEIITGLLCLVVFAALWGLLRKSLRNNFFPLLTDITKSYLSFFPINKFINARISVLLQYLPDFVSKKTNSFLLKTSRPTTTEGLISNLIPRIRLRPIGGYRFLPVLLLLFIFIGSANGATRTASVSGNWTNVATWGGAAVPVAGDDVIINSGVTVTVDVNTAGCRNMEIQSGGTLTLSNTMVLEIQGNWVNNGSFTANTGTVIFSGPGSTFTGNSQTSFYNLTLNKSNGLTDIIEFASSGTVTCTHYFTPTRGLLKLTSGTLNLNCNSAFKIEKSSGIWIAGSGAILNTGGFTITNEGLIRISLGTASFGTESGNSVHTQVDGAFEVTNGNVFIAGRLENTAGGFLVNPSIPSGLNISGGTVTIGTIGNGASGDGTLDVTTNGAFRFLGGTIIFQYSSTASTPLDVALVLGSGNGAKSTVGGTFQLGNASTPPGTIFRINSEVPIDNLTLMPNASVQLVGNNLTISNQLKMQGGNIDAATNNKKVVLTKPNINALDNSSGFIDGTLERAIGTGATYLFPVTNPNDVYTPLLLSFTGQNATGTMTVFSVNGDLGALGTSLLNPLKSVNNYWVLTNSGVVFTEMDIDFDFPAELGDGGNYIAGAYNGLWSYPTVLSSSSNSVKISGIGAFGGNISFALAECLIPTISLEADPVVCEGTLSTSVAFSAAANTPDKYKLDFTNASFSDVGWSTLSASPIPLTLPVGLDPGTYSTTLYVRNATGCESSGVNFSITINPTTSITSQSTATQTQCIGGTFTPITVTASGTGSLTYQWYSNASASNTGGTSLGTANGANTNSYTPPTTTAGTLYYYCEVHSDCGPNVTSAISGAFVTNPATSITSQSTATQTQCIGGTFAPITVTASGTGTLTYQWYSNTSASNTGGTSLGTANGANTNSYTPPTTTAGTLYYYCEVHSDCGPNVTSAISGAFITNPQPTVTTTLPDKTYCMGETTLPIPLSGSPSNVIFDISGGAAIGLTDKTGVTQIPAYPASTGTAAITITPRANGCTGTPVTFNVTVNPRPNIQLSASSRTICSGGSTNVSLTSSTPGATFSWTVYSTTGTITGANSGTGNLLDQTLFNHTATTGSVVYQITAKNGDCEGATINLTVTVHPEVTATIAGSTTVCQNDDPAPVVTFTANGGAAPYTFTYNINGGASQQATVASGNTAPISAPTGVAGTLNYKLVSVAGSTGCAYPQTGTATIIVNPMPVLTSSLTPPGICGNTVFSYAPTSNVAGTTFTWTRETISGIQTAASSGQDGIDETLELESWVVAPIQVTYTYTLTSPDGCVNTQNVVVAVTPTPLLTSATMFDPICEGITFSYTPTSNVSGTTFNWSRAAVGGNAAASGTGGISEVLSNNTTSPRTITYEYYLSSNNCNNSTPYYVTVSVLPSPNVTASSSDTEICPGESVNLFSSSDIVTTTVSTTLVNPDFNNWTRDPTSGSAAWTLRDDGYSYSTTTFHSNDASQFYLANSQAAGNTNITSSLVSPPFSTVGYTSITMTFWQYYLEGGGSDRARIQWSTNGTSGWTDLVEYTSSVGSSSGFVQATVSNIPVSESTVYVRFYYTAKNDNYWAIDNVSITGVLQNPPTISWSSNPAGFTSSVANPTNVSPTETTTYTVTYTDPDTGCNGSASTTVTVYPEPNATISANYCVASPKIRLTTGVFTTYNWSPLPLGQTNGQQYIDIDIAGIYTVNVTDANGCTGTAFINVSNEYVTNGSFSSGNTGFTTPPSGSNQYTYVANNLSSTTELWPEGLYGIGTNAQNYHSNFWGVDHTTGTGNFMIVNGFPGSPQPIVWQQTISNLLPNTDYYFSAWAISLNSAGNDAKLRFSINGNQLGTIADLTTIPGVSNNSNPWRDEGRFYGIWNSGSNTSAVLSIVDLQIAPNGNDFGLDDISFGILDPAPADIAPTSSNNICSGDTIKLYANVTGGKEPIGFNWTGPNGFTSNLEDPVIPNADEAYGGTYTLTVTDWYGCNIPAETTSVIVYPKATVNAGPDQLTACSATSAFTLNGSRGGAATSSIWTSNGTGTFNDATSLTAVYTISAADVAAGSVTLTLTTDDPTGPCSAVSDDMIITISRSPELSVAIEMPLCAGNSDGSATASVTNGIAPFTYLWSNGQTTAKATGLADGTYTVTVTDAKGCTDTETITVVEPTALVVSPASFKPPGCYGGNDGWAEVVAEGGTEPYVYQWDATAGNQTTKRASNLTVGVYMFTVTDANGCNITTDFVLVTQPEPPTLLCPSDPDPVQAALGETTAEVSLDAPVYDPNCQVISWTMSGATVVSTPVPGIVPSPYTFNVGTTIVEYTTLNKANEELTCTFDVVVIPNDPPDIKCVDPAPVTATASQCSASLTIGFPTINAGANITWDWVMTGATADSGTGAIPDPHTFNVGTTIVTWTATNIAGTASCTQTIVVTDTQKPVFTPPADLNECVTNIITAVFNAATTDINPDRPEYYTFLRTDKRLDLNTASFSDNCGVTCDIEIRWRIDFSGGTAIPSVDPASYNTGQVSAYLLNNAIDIQFPGDQPPYNDNLEHTITYWIVDCHNNVSEAQHTTFTVTPRPNVIKMN